MRYGPAECLERLNTMFHICAFKDHVVNKAARCLIFLACRSYRSEHNKSYIFNINLMKYCPSTFCGHIMTLSMSNWKQRLTAKRNRCQPAWYPYNSSFVFVRSWSLPPRIPASAKRTFTSVASKKPHVRLLRVKRVCLFIQWLGSFICNVQCHKGGGIDSLLI